MRAIDGMWVILLIISLFACEEANNSSAKEVQTELKGTLAVVTTRFQNEGCEVLLEIEEEGEKVLLMPIHLEDSFKVDGKQLEITFHSSRIMQSNCQLGRPVVLDLVKFVD